MVISLIAAVGSNWVIGKGGDLPWHLPADLKRFKSLTLGKPVIMGRKTYESIGHPLSQRKNIVMTTSTTYHVPGCHVVHSITQALETAEGDDEAMIIGGAAIYRQFWPIADRIYLTEIDEVFEGDVFFPELNLEEWKELSRISEMGESAQRYHYHFVVYERRKGNDERIKEGGISDI